MDLLIELYVPTETSLFGTNIENTEWKTIIIARIFTVDTIPYVPIGELMEKLIDWQKKSHPVCS